MAVEPREANMLVIVMSDVSTLTYTWVQLYYKYDIYTDSCNGL